MAAEDGEAARHLTFLAEVAGEARRWGMFPAVRGAEARAGALPRVGRSRRPSQNAVDLAQVPALTFPAPTIDSVEFRNGRAQLNGFWLGLTGPMGALPTHLTEFAYFEQRYGRERPFGRWLDVLAGRMLQLFYRAWADSQPAAQADRPEDDRFAAYLAALTGATEGVGEAALFPARARLHYAALFASRRSAVAIEDALAHLLRQPVEVREYQPRWRAVEPEDQTRLGRQHHKLGSAMLGKSVRTASDAFRVVVRAATMRELEALLPGSARFGIAQEGLDAFAPSHLEWDIVIEIPEPEARPARLDGRARLGWTSWMAPRGRAAIRTDTHLRRRRPARTHQGEMP